ncbi:MAG TPA: GAP family protein [Solirubrobacterales bacterium]|nr:GAP family protein [Solirubrobacterales bacterium]
MLDIFLLSLVAAANAGLLAAVTVMLFLPDPKRLLLGYLAGGLLVSLTIGFLIVFVVDDPSVTESAREAVSPSIDVALGLIALLVAYVLGAGHDRRVRERRQAQRPAVEKGPSRVEQLLGRGSARVTFALGVVLTLPGVAYLAALRELKDGGYGVGIEILVILGFNLMLLILLEVPLAGYLVAPERTVVEVQRFRAWLTHHGRTLAVDSFLALGAFLLARAAAEYLLA